MENKRPAHRQGRKPKNSDIRDARVAFYLTKSDADYLADLASRLGFKSRSELCVAIVERLIIGGFSGRVFDQVGAQFAQLIADNPEVQQGLYFGLRPLPPLFGDEEKDHVRAFAESYGKELHE